MKKLGMLGIIGGAALLTAAPEAGLRGASIEGSTAGPIAARLMQPQRLEWPDTAMAHITAIAIRTIPATTRRSRTRAITGPCAPSWCVLSITAIPHPARAITCHPLRA
jgi:hypothetical protein